MYYPEEIIDEIREKNRIEDVIAGYVRLKKQGSNFFGLCPFHNEKSPSFSVSPAKQIYYCFGCGAGGNVITFVMEYENYTFSEAIKMLADRAGVKLPEELNSPEIRKRESRRAKLLEIAKEAAKFYYYQLRSANGKPGMEYLESRELTEKTRDSFGLGYSPTNSNALITYLKKMGYEDELIIAAGIANYNEKYGMSDKLWNRVVFPIQDTNHRVIGFGGRVIGDGKPKYLNSPGTEIFDKGRNLYGLNFARTSRKKEFILCEGYMDVIALHQADFTQAVASLGTAFTSGQANLLHRYTEEVLLIYDSDDAGVKAALRAIPILKEAGLVARIVNLKPYKDPDEFIKRLGKEEFQKRLDEAENSFYYEVRIMQEGYSMDDPESKTRFHRELAKRLCEFSEEVERENYLTAIAEKYFISSDNLRKLVNSYAMKTGFVQEIKKPLKTTVPKTTKEEFGKKSQKLLLTWICEEPAILNKIKTYISEEDFITPMYQTVAKTIIQEIEEESLNMAKIISMFETQEEQKEVASLFNTHLLELKTKEEREKALHDILVSVKKNAYEYYSEKMGVDITAISKVVEAKQSLEKLAREQIQL